MTSKPETQTTTKPPVRLNNLQYGELHRVRQGKGHYWPIGREIATLKVLANRRLVTFDPGYGWSLLPDGDAVLNRYLKENSYAFV